MMIINKNNIRLGKTIRGYRKQVGWTQEHLAEKVDLSTKYIQFIENGNREPSLSTVYKIAKAFKVKVHDCLIFR